MNDCLNLVKYNSSDIIFNNCQDVYSVWIHQDKEFTRESLNQIANDCFELSKERLIEESEQDIMFGQKVFDYITYKITSLVVEFNPINFGFSISLEPSLHYIIRFQDDVTLFFETYIDHDTGLETYVQIYKGKKAILSIKESINDALFYVEETLQENLNSRTPYFKHA